MTDTVDTASLISKPWGGEVYCSCPLCAMLQETGQAGAPGAGTGGLIIDSNYGLTNTALLNLQTRPDGTRYFSGERDVDAALIGSKWTLTNLTFSFPTSANFYLNGYPQASGNNSPYGLIEFNEQQKAATRYSLALVASYTNLTFTEITETATDHATLRLIQTNNSGTGSASGFFPGDRISAGDIQFGRTSQPFYETPAVGNWGQATNMHELGHTLGLKHGHQDYTNTDLSFYFGTAPRYGSQALTVEHNGQSWSLMTYASDPGAGYNPPFQGDQFNQPQTYAMYDIAALQYMYGANYNTNSGNTIYTWSTTTGVMSINGVAQATPTSNKIFSTIWDGGGVDTYDLSNYATDLRINLNPGQHSTFSVEQLANVRNYSGELVYAAGNIGNALLFQGNQGSMIENATGGTGNDTIIGNIITNVLIGNGGNDTLDWGGGGSDTLNGGAGSDTAILTTSGGVTADLATEGVSSASVITVDDNGAQVAFDTVTLIGIENIVGGAGSDNLSGNDAANMLSGGTLGNDILTGRGGDDVLMGSGFTASSSYNIASDYDAGDINKPQAQANTSIATAVVLTAQDYDLQANGNIGNATTTPHATINAVAAGGGLEYYAVTVAAGATITLDIDGTALDTVIDIVTAGGVQLAVNDDGTLDSGSTTSFNSYLTYTFATAGTYYVRVGQYTNSSTVPSNLTAGQTYTLHISQTDVNQTFSVTQTGSLIADGGTGNDLIFATTGNDRMDGGADTDTVSYANVFVNTNNAGVTVTLAPSAGATGGGGVFQSTGIAGADMLTGIENLIGSRGNDTLTGDSGNNVIEGGLGNDVMDGAGGRNTATYAGSTAGVSVSLLLQGQAQNTVGAGTDTLLNFQDLVGSAFNDTLTGDAQANTLNGGAGDDTLVIATAATGPTATRDTLIGGDGIDTLTLTGANNATVSLAVGAAYAANGQVIANLSGIENVTGGDGNDSLAGNALNNVLIGGAGNNTLSGGDGDDRLVGGAGNDVFDGGANGALGDTVDFSALTGVGVALNLSVAGPQATGQGNDTFIGIENVITTAGVDTLIGTSGNNIFYDRGGADTYTGNGGSDTVDYSSSTVVGAINLATSTYTGYAAGDTLNAIDNIVGSATAANTLVGNANNNSFTGGAVADNIQAGAGNDTIFGGGGNDLLYGENVGDLTNAGVDTIDGGDGADIIFGGLGADILRGGAGNDTIVSGAAAAATTIDIANFGGFDSIDGGAGVTDLAYYVMVGQTGDLRFDLTYGANNSVFLNNTAVASIINIERLFWYGGAGRDTVTGWDNVDTLYGYAGDDILNGGAANDILFGGLGNDILNGGYGQDTASYAELTAAQIGTAGVFVSLRTTSAQNTGAAGVDTLIEIESLTGTINNDILIGNDNANTLTGGDGDDYLVGGLGEDIFSGGNGVDTVDFSDLTLGITVSLATTAAQTINTAYGYATRTIATVENLIGGTGGDTITGSTLANVLNGNAGNDVITGGAGNDTIIGGAGLDTARYTSVSTNYTITRNANGTVTVTDNRATGSEGTDTLSTIERIQFTDRTINLRADVGSNFANDTRADLIFRNTATGQIVIWNGADSAQSSSPGAVGTNYNIYRGDLNGNGVTDLIFRSTTDGTIVVWADGNANNSTVLPQGATLAGYAIEGVGDFNSDGIDDILFRNAAGDMGYVSGNGNGMSLGGVPLQYEINVGDFDGDGRDDILFRDTGSGNLIVWNGGDYTQSSFIGGVGVEYEISTGDFDGDGRSDILFKNVNNGFVVTWSGGNSNNSVYRGQVAPNADVLTGDFTGDGQSDVVFRNADGSMVLWASANSANPTPIGVVGSPYEVFGAPNDDVSASPNVVIPLALAEGGDSGVPFDWASLGTKGGVADLEALLTQQGIEAARADLGAPEVRGVAEGQYSLEWDLVDLGWSIEDVLALRGPEGVDVAAQALVSPTTAQAAPVDAGAALAPVEAETVTVSLVRHYGSAMLTADLFA